MTETVWVVLKNADFTEGRGPMRFHKVFKTAEDARNYIMDQPGIFGSSQGLMSMMSKNSANGAHYNGYQLVQTELIAEYDREQVAAKRAEKERLEEKLKDIQQALKALGDF